MFGAEAEVSFFPPSPAISCIFQFLRAVVHDSDSKPFTLLQQGGAAKPYTRMLVTRLHPVAAAQHRAASHALHFAAGELNDAAAKK
eukprot:CAMPEP_0119364932 /NCGR_PEP_ID=MMETSP1334-20130426/11855_1 /TAXON_ID=127549 /ORGANISM="Calcidiscus leptoporus, Strain RCC1130" /LENGTH=85 /DNA_ID=CAMNT_0007380765 /DNA_START=293 /DNA_END=547 /DNA_ORIENTATION=-